MATPASEIKEKYTKLVELPSGVKIRIKKMDPETFAAITPIFEGFESMDDKARRRVFNERYAQFAKIVFPGCCIEPKVVASEPGEDEIHYTHIGSFDGIILLTEIFEHSGISGMTAERIETFRPKYVR